MKYLLFNIIFVFCFTPMVYGQHIPSWEEGYLDIHHTNTGRGMELLLLKVKQQTNG